MKRFSLSLWIGCLLLMASLGAQSKPEYLDVLTQTYQSYPPALSSRACVNCHISDSDFGLNPFGKQVAQGLLTAGTKSLTPEILHGVEPLASHPGDISNLEKIKKGLAPGTAKAAGPGETAGTSGTASPAPVSSARSSEQKSLLPKNAYHPAIVHFPIALFLCGLLFDLIGFVRNNRTFLLAGWYNLIAAAVSSFGAIATGVLAIWIMKLPLQGLIRTHLLLAVLGTLLMWALVVLRFRRHENMSQPLRIAYISLAVVGMLLISYSAHLGGAFVYGE